MKLARRWYAGASSWYHLVPCAWLHSIWLCHSLVFVLLLFFFPSPSSFLHCFSPAIVSGIKGEARTELSGPSSGWRLEKSSHRQWIMYSLFLILAFSRDMPHGNPAACKRPFVQLPLIVLSQALFWNNEIRQGNLGEGASVALFYLYSILKNAGKEHCAVCPLVYIYFKVDVVSFTLLCFNLNKKNHLFQPENELDLLPSGFTSCAD